MKLLLKLLILSIILIGHACNSKNHAMANKTAEDYITLNRSVKRYGSVIKAKPEMLEQYKALHFIPWPGVLEQITKSNIRNYSIFLKDGYLFSYFEYLGDDYNRDLAEMAKDSVTQEWWKLTDPCQEPLAT